MARVGGDIGQLAQLKSTFDRQSQMLQDLTRTIGGQVEQAWWVGAAAERFKSQWRSEYDPALKRLQAALGDAAREVEQRRAALEQAGS